MKQDARVILMFAFGVGVLGLIVAGPLLYAIKLSFYATDSFIAKPRWVGFENYTYILTDPIFWKALLNGLSISLATIVLQVVLGVGIALVLNRQFAGQSIVRSLAVLPYFLPTVVACLVLQWLLDPNYGLVKSILGSMGLRMFDWSADPLSAKSMVVLVSVWLWTPFVVTCVLAGLQSIPTQLYEAAKVDGAGPVTQFFHVTLPGLSSVLVVVVLLRSIWMFNKFDVIWLLTKGGPLNETETLPTLAYRKAFVEFDLGGGAAVATTSFALLAAVILVYLRFFPLDTAERRR